MNDEHQAVQSETERKIEELKQEKARISREVRELREQEKKRAKQLPALKRHAFDILWQQATAQKEAGRSDLLEIIQAALNQAQPLVDRESAEHGQRAKAGRERAKLKKQNQGN